MFKKKEFLFNMWLLFKGVVNKNIDTPKPKKPVLVKEISMYCFYRLVLLSTKKEIFKYRIRKCLGVTNFRFLAFFDTLNDL